MQLRRSNHTVQVILDFRLVAYARVSNTETCCLQEDRSRLIIAGAASSEDERNCWLRSLCSNLWRRRDNDSQEDVAIDLFPNLKRKVEKCLTGMLWHRCYPSSVTISLRLREQLFR
jgi:hypothetical protein